MTTPSWCRKLPSIHGTLFLNLFMLNNNSISNLQFLFYLHIFIWYHIHTEQWLRLPPRWAGKSQLSSLLLHADSVHGCSRWSQRASPTYKLRMIENAFARTYYLIVIDRNIINYHLPPFLDIFFFTIKYLNFNIENFK